MILSSSLSRKFLNKCCISAPGRGSNYWNYINDFKLNSSNIYQAYEAMRKSNNIGLLDILNLNVSK